MKLSVDEMHENLMWCWWETTPLQRYRGSLWYPFAHDLAEVIAGGNVPMGAGLLAALSPQKSWDINRTIAIDAAQGYFHGQVDNAIGKARAIYDGAEPTEILPMHKKTGHFYMNILAPNDPAWVTIDRHAIRAASLDWDNGSPAVTDKQYVDFVVAYQRAAKESGVVPSAFQAGIWLYARER
jgi:hypothetical protein